MLVQPGLSAAERMSLNVRWANLRRDTPDAGAKDALPLRKWNITYYLNYISFSAINLVYIPYLTVKHFTRKDGFEGWGYTRMIRNRLGKLWERLLVGRMNAEAKNPIVRPKSTKRVYEQAERQGDLNIVEVMISPIGEDMRVGVGVNEHVEAVDVAAYWLTPRGCQRKGEETAGEDEKVILHIHGG